MLYRFCLKILFSICVFKKYKENNLWLRCNICNVISSAIIHLYLHLVNISASGVFRIANNAFRKYMYLKLKYAITLPCIVSVIFNCWGDSYNSIFKLILYSVSLLGITALTSRYSAVHLWGDFKIQSVYCCHVVFLHVFCVSMLHKCKIVACTMVRI